MGPADQVDIFNAAVNSFAGNDLEGLWTGDHSRRFNVAERLRGLSVEFANWISILISRPRLMPLPMLCRCAPVDAAALFQPM
jgi:hypothetical protein